MSILQTTELKKYGNVKKCAVGKYPKSEKHGNTAQYAVVARKASSANGSTAQKSNGKWFVGGLNATDKPLTLTLDLPMFAGKTVEYLTDMPKKKGDKFFTSVKKTLKVGKDGKAKVTIQPMGGIVID